MKKSHARFFHAEPPPTFFHADKGKISSIDGRIKKRNGKKCNNWRDFITFAVDNINETLIKPIMKLAEALSIRKDLQKRIQQLGQRIQNNVKVQEGDEPKEQPAELMRELDGCLNQLQELIWRINATNMATKNAQGKTLTELMAQKDVLTMRIGSLRSIFDTASAGQDRYSRSEIKMVTVIDVRALNKQIDNYSAQLRKLDIEIQSLNFQTELLP